MLSAVDGWHSSPESVGRRRRGAAVFLSEDVEVKVVRSRNWRRRSEDVCLSRSGQTLQTLDWRECEKMTMNKQQLITVVEIREKRPHNLVVSLCYCRGISHVHIKSFRNFFFAQSWNYSSKVCSKKFEIKSIQTRDCFLLQPNQYLSQDCRVFELKSEVVGGRFWAEPRANEPSEEEKLRTVTSVFWVWRNRVHPTEWIFRSELDPKHVDWRTWGIGLVFDVWITLHFVEVLMRPGRWRWNKKKAFPEKEYFRK